MQRDFDFDAVSRSRLELVRRLHYCNLPAELLERRFTPGRVRGVVELLERLILAMRQSNAGSVRACKTWLAARGEGRRSVGERTIANWSRDAQALGVIDVIVESREFGGARWNTWVVNWSKINQLVGNGEGQREEGKGQRTLSPDSCPLTPSPNQQSRGGQETVGNGRKRFPTRSEMVSTPTTNQERSNKNNPPPPPDSPSIGWEEAGVALRVAGVGDWTGAIERARSNGAAPCEVQALVARFREFAAGLYGPEALHWRVGRCSAGDDPQQGWPPPKGQPIVEQQRQAAAAREQDQRRRACDELAQQQHREAEREAKYGAQVDRLSPQERIDLLRGGGARGAVEIARRQPDSLLVRGALLRVLEAGEGQREEGKGQRREACPTSS